MAIFNSITDLIGNTPLVRLDTFASNRNLKANIIAKVEFFNPGGSVKDRVALSMILDAEEKGILKKGGTIWVKADNAYGLEKGSYNVGADGKVEIPWKDKVEER